MDDVISRQAAIDEAEEWIEAVYCGHDEQRERDAIKHVINGIKKLPSAQPELIEQGAYVRGFEQGRTQGMIDAQGEKMNKQRKVVITVTYNELGTIVDTKAEELDLSAQPEQRWIPCSVRLPKQGQEVICQCRANIIKVLKLDADDDWYQDADHCYMGGFVTAWMPLPEPYREEGENE